MANTVKTHTYTNTGTVDYTKPFAVSIPEFENLTYVSHTATLGTYDQSTHEWTIPELSVGESESISITYSVEVTSSCESSTGCTGTCTQPIAEVVDITLPAPTVYQGCLPASSGCTCGDQSITVSNEDNVEVTMSNSGQYTAIVADPGQPWSFEYTITCTLDEVEYGPFGPGIVEGEGPAQSEPVVELVTFTGGETSYTVTAPMPTNNANVTVSLMGLEMYEGIDYDINGQDIEFNFVGVVGEVMKVKIEY